MFKNVGVVIKAFNNPSDLEIDSIALLMNTLCKHCAHNRVYVENANRVVYPKTLLIYTHIKI